MLREAYASYKKRLNQIVRKNHKGNPYENQEGSEGSCWWLKDPEWVWLCPACWDEYWSKFIEELKKENGRRNNKSKKE